MKFSFHPEAEIEFEATIDYYEACELGLGYDFSLEILTSIKAILDFPSGWPLMEDGCRRCLVNRFPYGIIYSLEENDEIFILSIMHLRRRPGQWKMRIG